MPIHVIPNSNPLNIVFRGDDNTNSINGITPSRNGRRHITIKRLLFSGKDAKATKTSLPFSFPIVTAAFPG